MTTTAAIPFIIGFCGMRRIGKSYAAAHVFLWFKTNRPDLFIQLYTEKPIEKTWNYDVVIIENVTKEEKAFIRKNNGVVIRIYNDDTWFDADIEDSVLVKNDKTTDNFIETIQIVVENAYVWFKHVNKYPL